MCFLKTSFMTQFSVHHNGKKNHVIAAVFFSDVCDTDWCRTRDGLIASTFGFSIIAFAVACIFTVVVGYDKSE